MNERRKQLQRQLGDLLAELEKLNKSKLPQEELKSRLRDLYARRQILENEMIDLVIEDDESYRDEAWDGLMSGLQVFVHSLQESLKEPTVKATKKSANFFTAAFTHGIALITKNPVLAWLSSFVLIYLLLLAVSSLGSGFKEIFGGAAGAEQLFAFASNPFMGLVLGALATALIQSSSTTTSVIVALCAAGLPISTAIPMILGANVGTSVTNTLVSLGHIGNKHEFRRAFAAATVHDFFNLLAILIFLPLEMMTGFLEKLSGWFTGFLFGAGSELSLESLNFLAPAIKPVEAIFQKFFWGTPGPAWIGNTLFILFGLFLIFFSILILGKVLRTLLTGRAEKIFHATVGKNPITAIGSGLAITVLVQSSSTTTSLIVPLAGSGVMSLKEVYPFTLGANIGTCVTTLLAALAITGASGEAALQIAFIHFLFNFLGVVLIYGLFILRRIPMVCASSLARIAVKRKSLAFAYVVGVFFVFPLSCLGIYKLF